MPESLSIAGVDTIVDGAWAITDPSMKRLRGQGDFRGDDFVIHGLDGVVAEPVVQHSWRIPIVMFVYGTLLGETSGAPSTKRQGVLDNIAYLKSQWLPPYAGGSATITATLTDPDAGTAAADVRVTNFQVIDFLEGAKEDQITFDLFLPGGKFA